VVEYCVEVRFQFSVFQERWMGQLSSIKYHREFPNYFTITGPKYTVFIKYIDILYTVHKCQDSTSMISNCLPDHWSTSNCVHPWGSG
jgi:hypothetical protein